MRKEIIKHPKFTDYIRTEFPQALSLLNTQADSISRPGHIPAPTKATFQQCFLSTS